MRWNARCAVGWREEAMGAAMSKGRRVTLKKGTGSQMRKLVLAVAKNIASGKAFALGLGEIQLHSSLIEPLNAEIQLISERPAVQQGAVARLAPQDAFSQAGSEWPAVLGDLKFTVVQQNGATVVKVTSSQPVREPFLDFIVQLQWPSGRLLREYTVLLDPPMFSGEKAAPIAAPIASAPTSPSPSPAPAAAPAAETPAAVPSKPKSTTPAPSVSSSRPAAATPVTRPAVGPNGYGPTQRADTAWAVANQVRPDPSVTVQQAMLALLEANPEAFYSHNVNNLIAGHVLRIPARELMTAVSAVDAEREVTRQFQQWRQTKSGVPVTAEAPAVTKSGSAADASASTPAKGEQASRLRLAAPGASAATAPGAGGGKDIDKLHNDLAIALESADAARRENEELRSRLGALEGQINSMQRLLTLKDGTLADMQKQPGAATATPPPPTPPAAEAPSAPAPAEGPVPATPKPPVTPAAPAETPPQSFNPFDNPALLAAAGGGVLLLLALAWLIERRRREGATSEAARLEPIVAHASATAAAAQATRANTVESAVAAADAASLNPQMGAVAEEVARGVEGAGAETANALDMLHTAEGDIDPVVEAAVYLAYRRYQQAEALLQAALATQPPRLELKVKLLEIYYAARNTDSFRSVAESLHNDLWRNPDDALWQRVVTMGAELLPDHILFAGGADAKVPGAPMTAGAGAALFAAGDAAAKVADGELPPAPQEDFLGLGAGDTAAARISGGEESLDLDLNLGAQQAEITHGGDGLDDTVRGAAGVVPDIETGKDAVAATGTDKSPSSSWQTEPALSDFGMDFNLDDADVVGTKLDLARAYIDMGDHDSARDILKEVMSEGNPQQKQEAQTLSQQLA